MKTSQFINFVNNEFDIETLELMQGVISKRLGDLQNALDAADPRTVVQGFKRYDLQEMFRQILKEAATNTNEVIEQFAQTREKGAEKIANSAKEKGGLALLTWHHFKVKLPYYKKAAEGKLDFEKAKKEYEETYKKISLNTTQIEFQREVGRLEVLGELLIKNK